MYEGYLSFGCNEVLNASRAFWYTQTADCSIDWLRLTYCDNLADALNDGVQYDAADITEAPWYDPNDPATERFYGAYPVSISGISDSTRTATITEGILDGGTVTGYRHTVRQIRVQAMLIARGQDALEAGLSWLEAALAPDTCSAHGAACGEVDLQFFNSCPPRRVVGESDEEYQDRVDSVVRTMHGVSTISGPTVIQKLRRDAPQGGEWGYLVEFILAAATPWVFGLPREVVLPPTTPVVVTDDAVNLVPYPSAELSSGTVVVATNYSMNPSAESNASGFTSTQDGVVILPARLSTVARVTDSFSVGAASAGTTFTANTTSATPGWFALQQTVGFGGGTGVRVSINVWAQSSLGTGTVSFGPLEVYAVWSGGTPRTDLIGQIPLNASGPGTSSGSLSVKSLVPPLGATVVVVQVRQRLNSFSTGAVVRLYMDALAVTIP